MPGQGLDLILGNAPQFQFPLSGFQQGGRGRLFGFAAGGAPGPFNRLKTQQVFPLGNEQFGAFGKAPNAPPAK